MRKTFVSGEEVIGFIADVRVVHMCVGLCACMSASMCACASVCSCVCACVMCMCACYIYSYTQLFHPTIMDILSIHTHSSYTHTHPAGEGQGHPCSSLSQGTRIHPSDASLIGQGGTLHARSRGRVIGLSVCLSVRLSMEFQQ